MKHWQRQKHLMRRLAGLLLALALAVSLVGTTGLPALAASETADDSAAVLASEESGAEEVTLSGGETITEGGTYRLADGATGMIKIRTTDAVVIEGSGVSWDDSCTMTCTEYEDLHFSCMEGADLTLKDAFITNNGEETASLVDFTGDGNRLSIEGTVDLENLGITYALIHVGLGTSLTIAGTGTLYLYKYNQGAGIGGDAGELNGDITFGDENSSLTVFAKGSKQGALIGAGADAASDTLVPGSISFVEGTYNLVSVSRGAVIGGSAGSGGASDGTTVYVGTKVNMNINVDYTGAAVGGGGYDTGNDSSGGTLYVTGGSLRCYIDSNAAGNTTGWNGQGYTEGINDAAITAQRLDASGEAVYRSSFDSTLLDEEAEYFEVYVDGELFYEGGLPEYGYVQELLDKSEQLSITSTVSNWYKNGETNLYFYLTGKDHTVTVNGEAFAFTWDSVSGSFTVAEVVTARYDVTENLENITSSGDAAAREGKKYKAALTAADGYVLPGDITVAVSGETLTAGTGYSYSNVTGELVIYSAYTTGPITITAAAVADTYAASVTAGDTITYYGTVEDAFTYANSLGTSCTVALRADCPVTESLAAGSGSEITLDLAGHTLSASGSPVSVLTANGSLTVTDSSEGGCGTVTGGTGTSIGGVSYGGGIYVPAGGSLTVEGGCITGNTADYGGGIYAAGAVSLSGTPVVTGNTGTGSADGAENNLYLVSGNVITLAGSLAEGADVGVTAADTPLEGSDIQITAAETATSYYKDAAAYLSSDAGYYVVPDTDTGCLALSLGEARAASVETEDGGTSYYSSVEEAFSAVNSTESSCTVTLLADCDITESLTLDEGHTVTLDLDGHTLAAKEGSAISVITVNGAMTLDDSSGAGTGTVTGGTGTGYGLYVYGGGVYVSASGSFTMAGGNITGNTLAADYDSTASRNEGLGYGAYGGGVCAMGSFTMTGGSVSGNVISGYYDNDLAGGGVYAAGGFSMAGGSVDGNSLSGSTYSYGGGVYISGSGTLSGGSISSNVVSLVGTGRSSGYGGGLACFGGTLTMTGGVVSGNTLSCEAGYGYGRGGGIYVNTSLVIYGGEISSNVIRSVQYAYGGGACRYTNSGLISGKMVMYGGTITGNSISASGTYASGAYGGGKYPTGSSYVYGGSVVNNLCNNTADTDIETGGYGIETDLDSLTLDTLTALYEADYTGTLSADTGFALPESVTLTCPVTGELLTAGEDYTYDAQSGALTIYASAVTGPVKVTGEGVRVSYSVSTSLSGLTMEGGGRAAVGEDYSAVLAADTDYVLPEKITVTAGGTKLTAGEDYVYDAESGALTIYAPAVTGDIVITASGLAPYNVSTSLKNISMEGDTHVVVGTDYTAVLAADSGYSLPETITVTSGGTVLTAGEGYAYDAESGALTIYADSITGDIVINAAGTDEAPLGKDEDGCYRIGSEEDLISFADMVENGYAGSPARLTADITVAADSGFAGIGTSDVPFTGTFDGDGHTVTLSLSTDNAAGLFAFVSGAVIGDVTVAGTVESTVNTYGCAGLVSCVMAGGVTIENCVNKADINGVGYVGGLVGRTSGSISYPVEVTVVGSSNEGSVTSTGNYAGGIVSYTYSGSITGCINSGIITGTGYTGGIIGYAYSADGLEILECGNEGSVTGSSSYTGGIAGYARKASSASLGMDSLYNAGAVSGTSYVGGLAGRSYADISNAYNVGAVNGTAASTGGLIGANFGSGAVLSNAYNAGEVSYTSSDVAYTGGLLIGSISSASYLLYVDNVYYLDTLEGSVIASGSSYLCSSSTQAALTDGETAAMAKASGELAALADTLGESFAGNTDADYHLGYPVLTWEAAGDEGDDSDEGDHEGNEDILNGLYADGDGRLAYYVDGVVDTAYTGVAAAEDGITYYVESGYVGSYTGLAKATSDGTWYYFTESVLDADYTGLVKNAANGILYYVSGGTVGWDYTGPAKYAANGCWYYVSGGTICWTYTGLAKNAANGIWYYFADGALDWGYTGFVKHSNGVYYYVANGQLDWGYSGWAEYNGASYYVSSGQLDWEKTAEGR